MEAGKWAEAAGALTAAMQQRLGSAEMRRTAIYYAAVLLLQVIILLLRSVLTSAPHAALYCQEEACWQDRPKP